MRHLLYLMFRCDVDVMENLELGGVFFGTKHSLDLRSAPNHTDRGYVVGVYIAVAWAADPMICANCCVQYLRTWRRARDAIPQSTALLTACGPCSRVDQASISTHRYVRVITMETHVKLCLS